MITDKQAKLLRVLNVDPGFGLSMAEAAVRCGWRRAATMAMISRLKKRGWVESDSSGVWGVGHYRTVIVGQLRLASYQESKSPPVSSRLDIRHNYRSVSIRIRKPTADDKARSAEDGRILLQPSDIGPLRRALAQLEARVVRIVR